MNFLILLLLSFISYAQPPIQWSSMVEVRERHEFYKDNEVITKPANSWQTLFAVVFVDRNLSLHKDCVFYKVPSQEETGTLKIIYSDVNTSCDSQIEKTGDRVEDKIKALQFSFSLKNLIMHFTDSNFRTTQWKIPMASTYQRPRPKLFLSSAEYRSPKITLLAPVRSNSQRSRPKTIEGLCHKIDETTCQEAAPSTCLLCPRGWYEIPNGCMTGQKYCVKTIFTCGGRNQPACRRGMKWQREDKKFDCRMDSSFAYCSPGHSIQCQGPEAFCR